MAVRLELLTVLEPIIQQLHLMQESSEASDDVSSVSRSAPAPASLEQLPHDVLHEILHQLPVKTTRNAFKLGPVHTS
jgi:hypothetical protein